MNLLWRKMLVTDVEPVLTILGASGFDDLAQGRIDHYTEVEFTWVVENDHGDVVGFAEGHLGCTDINGSMPTAAVLGVLAVHPDWRRLGIGRWLVRRFGEEFRSRSEYFVVQTSSDSPREFFRSIGFADRDDTMSSMRATMVDFFNSDN